MPRRLNKGHSNDLALYSPLAASRKANSSLVGTEMTNPAPQTQDAQHKDGAIDYIYGAENIARFLKVTLRKVYYLAAQYKVGKGQVPISNRPGFGLCVSEKALREYLKGGR